MTVARDVHSGFHNQLPLVRTGLRLEEQHTVALRRAGVHAIYVEDEHSDGIDVVPALSEETRALAMSALVRTFTARPAGLRMAPACVTRDAGSAKGRTRALIARAPGPSGRAGAK